MTALLWCADVRANVGIPMLALAWPLQWLAFIPIVLVECEVFRRALKLPFRAVVAPLAKANFWSTLVGVPLAWFVMLLIEFAVGGSLSLLPHAFEVPRLVEYALFPFMAAWVGDNKWQVLFAFLVLVVPFCAISIYIERRTLERAFSNQNSLSIAALTRRANIVSYALLSVFAVLYSSVMPSR